MKAKWVNPLFDPVHMPSQATGIAALYLNRSCDISCPKVVVNFQTLIICNILWNLFIFHDREYARKKKSAFMQYVDRGKFLDEILIQ